MKTKNKSLPPVYQNLRQAAAGMGLPLSLLRWAASQSAPGTTGSRIRPDELLLWLAANRPKEGDPIIGREQALLAIALERIRDLKRRNDEKDKLVIHRAWVAERMGAACAEWNRSRRDGKDGRCLVLAAEHGIPVAALRNLYDQATADGGAVLQQLAAVFTE